MSNIIIQDMSFPDDDELLVIRSDGTCTKYHSCTAVFWEDGKVERPTISFTIESNREPGIYREG